MIILFEHILANKQKQFWPLAQVVLAAQHGQSSFKRGWYCSGRQWYGQPGQWGCHGWPADGDFPLLAWGMSTSLRCCWGGSRVQAGLEMAGGDHVGPATYLELEEVMAPGQHAVGVIVEQLQQQHAVGVIVELLQQQHTAVVADQDCLSPQKVGRQVLRGLLGPSHIVPGRNDFGSTHSLRKIFVKIRFIKICIFIQKLARQNNRCAEYSLSGIDVVLLPCGGTQPQQDPVKVCSPARQAHRIGGYAECPLGAGGSILPSRWTAGGRRWSARAGCPRCCRGCPRRPRWTGSPRRKRLPLALYFSQSSPALGQQHKILQKCQKGGGLQTTLCSCQ
jgi:hypothetical protein